MAEAIAEGVRQVEGCEAVVKRVPETLSDEILGMMGALEAQKGMTHIPVVTVDDLVAADAIIFGTPTRCFCQLCHSTWRAGIDHTQLSYHAAAPRNGGSRSAVFLCRADEYW